ncbi:hypothetical protein ABZ756_03595 [Mammaliicoccus sciuri]|uniref:Uncharacterized protein n=2 Tax=Sporosarcina newyorkensis TaxID=759851 RepID=A0A1T4XPI6_9BACL|nr:MULTISPECIES: hypothetical protein [Sporosarcina]EGQ22535.1 hypothetical protein HMPREF9372_2862 [Sporosarcina newyorkensis 2681]MBY0222489.1 hypothetical protein [Sporosarcina aquimarina]SKA91008.1 hypothetical protein SAMN04244570_1065 [Sporosarcina newyorkensis]
MDNDFFQNEGVSDKQIAEIAFLGEAFGFLGDALTTFSAYLALQQISKGPESANDPDKLEMQQQIEYLMKEVERLKKQQR